MKAIGITGGVGAGKSQVMHYLKKHYSCEIILADEVAHELKEPGQACYEVLCKLLGETVLDSEKRIDKKRMADLIFGKETLLKEVNAILHPAVKLYILNRIKKAKEERKLDFIFVEAALLLEEKYDEILDEIWYIYAEDSIRRQRLQSSRNYSEDKIFRIMKNQMGEAEFRKRCKTVIDNGQSIEETYEQIKRKLEEYL